MRIDKPSAPGTTRISEAGWHALSADSPDWAALCTADGTLLACTAAVTNVLGFAVGEVVGRDLFTLVHPDDCDRMRQAFAEIVHQPAGARGALAACRVMRKDGSWRWIEGLATNRLADPTVRAMVTNLQDITERRQELAALALEHAQLVEQLEGSTRVKSEFVATMSHELRTPLNSIMGYTDLLIEREFGPLTDDQVGILRRVEDSAHQLLTLINQTLDISRMEAGRLPLEISEVEIPLFMAELDADTWGLRNRSNLAFIWQVAPQLPYLHTDPLKLKAILKNLIGNAIKFTPQGSITVAVDALDGGVAFCVSDTGVGIGGDVLPIIFEPFRQGDSSSTRRFGGVGLGLYIVRRLLDVLGGSVTVDSTVGQGSRFRVWLPVRADRSDRAGGSEQ